MTTRRAFIGSALAVGFATAAGTVSAQPASAPAKWDGEYDIVIVGAGGGGCSAAAEAAKKGLSVLVVEKQPIAGGSSVLCGGSFTLAQTEAQKKAGIEDNDQKFFDDMMKVGGNVNLPELVKAYIEKAPEQYAYITKTLGFEPYNIVAGAGMSAKRAHMFKPGEVVQAMRNDAEKHGAKFLFRCPAERLLWDDAGKQIVGVSCNLRGKKVAYRAKKGVLLASGGFSRNKELLNKWNPLMARADAEGGLGNTGDGMLMAQAYGADVLDTIYIKATHGYRPSEPAFKSTCHTYYSGAILVNAEGQRFVNESLSYKLLGDASLTLKDGVSYAVFDETVRELAAKDYPTLRDFKEDVNWCKKGATLEEVAVKFGVDPEGLKATVAKYNADVKASGKDSVFGRDSMSSGYGKLTPIEKAPFYIYPVKPRLIATYCGIRIDTTARVVDVFGQPIKGLWACGEVTGGLHGAAYMSGTAWGKAMVFGRIAAQQIAAVK